MSDTDVLARTDAVTRRYGDVVAVDEVTLEVGGGQAVGLLGPNGAGKSTLINLLCGLRRPTSGTVELFGGDPRDPARRRRLGTTPQETGLPANLRVREVLDFVGGHFADPVPTAEMLERVGLADQARRQTGGLSGGQRRRLSVALAFVGRPELVLLDEPTTGLDVEARREVWQLIRDFRADGGTVLLSSHNMDEVEALAGRVVIVDRGRVLADGPVDAVRGTVPLRRVRVTAPALPELPGVQQATRDGDRHELWAEDSDGVVRALAAADVPFRDLEVATASLEEAFLALTHEGVRPVNLALLHTRYQVLETLRVPIAVVGTTVFPVLSLLFFIAPQPFADEPVAATAGASQLAVFAVLSVCLFSYGVGVAEDRALPWDPYVRTLPAGLLPRLAGRLLTGLAFAILGLVPLVVLAWALTAATLELSRWPPAVLALALAGTPLLFLGLAVGYAMPTKAALAVAQALLLPLAFAGGLFLPPSTFPGWLDALSLWTPTRAGRDLVVWVTTGEPLPPTTLPVLVGWTVVTAAVAVWAYRRDEGRRFR